MSSKHVDLVLVGVGGLGALTAAEILGRAAVDSGMHVLAAEVHGMAQRGGVVTSTIRMGDVHGALIAKGTAHAILSFEPIEAYRAIEAANENTWIITSTDPIQPFTASVGLEKYPDLEEVYSELSKVSKRLLKVGAKNLATEAGAPIAANVVMLGALAGTGILPFSSDILRETIKNTVPKKFIDANMAAFEKGFELGTAAAGE